MRFDGKYAYDITAKLSYPRMVGSEGNAKARDQIENEMRAIGLDVTREDFNASTFAMGIVARWVMFAVAAPMFVGALAYKTGHPFWALIFGMATIICAWQASRIANDFKPFNKYGKQVPTQNVTGRFKSGGEIAHVALMAHFDTKSQPFPIELRIAAYLLGGLGILVGTGWLVVASLGALLGLWQAGGNALFIAALFGTAVSASLIWNKVENYSDGALDNAAGVGVITALSKAWVADPPKDMSLTVVATSAEEWGLLGAENWIEKHASELNPEKTIFLNYDSPGMRGGRILLTSKFGLPRREISGPELKADFEAACRELNIQNAKDVYIPFGASTDMMPVAGRGFRVLNILSLARGVHTKRDNISAIDANELQKAGDIGVKVIERFISRSK